MNLIIYLLVITSINTQIINVISPLELKSYLDNKIVGTFTAFGQAPLGTSIIRKVRYFPEIHRAFCNENDNNYIMNKDSEPFIAFVFLSDEDCSYKNMILAIESLNAEAIIIVYNKKVDDIHNIIIGDPNGWGRDVKIPGILITKEDGHKLKKFIDLNKANKDMLAKIYFEINFELPETDHVKYEIYFSNGYDKVYDLIRELSPIHEILGNKVKFEPKFITHKNIHFNYGLINDCLGAGKYCIYNIEYYFRFNGRDLILHNIREKCVWKSVEDNQILYFKFVDEYVKCVTYKDIDTNREDCFNEVLKNLNISIDDVSRCFGSNIQNINGINNLDDKNTIIVNLEEDRRDYNNNLIIFVPGISINNKPYYGSYTADGLFQAICASITKKPIECYKVGVYESKSNTWIYILIILGLLIFISIVYVLFKILLNRQVDNQIKSSIPDRVKNFMNSYLSLREVR